MEFIQPTEIASKIMTLMDEAELKLILVSPYNDFSKWIKMKKHLKSAIERGVELKYFIRDQKKIDLNQFKELNIDPIVIKDLHAKIYLNEKYAIMTSMNILEYSDINSLDFAYKTENSREYKEITSFIKIHLDKKISIHEEAEIIEPLTEKEIEILEKTIKKQFKTIKITNAKTYLFSKDLLYGFDLMISDKVIVKLKIYKPSDKNIFDDMYGDIYRVFCQTCKIILDTSESNCYISIVPKKEYSKNDRVNTIFEIIKKVNLIKDKPEK